jgi:autotransporter-associated beta strand protein
MQFWDGGSGTWNNTASNWTTYNGAINSSWLGGVAVFQGSSGTVTVSGPVAFQGLQFTSSGYTLAGSGQSDQLVPTGVADVNVGSGLTATISAPITGPGGLQTTGAGTLILSGSNTYSGGSAVNAGTIGIASNTALGASSGAVAMANGTTLQAEGNFGVANNIGITGIGTVDTQNNSLTLSGVISDGTNAGTLAKIGSGTLILSGANSYSGGTNLASGVLQVDAPSVMNGTTITSSAIGTGPLTLAGGTLQAGAAYTIANAATISSSGGTIDANGYTFTYSGAISGSGALTIANSTGAGSSGMVVLAGHNTYSGATTIENGATLAAGAANALSASSAITAGTGATLDLGSQDQTIAGLSGSGKVTSASNPNFASGTAVLTIAGGGHYGGTISDGTSVLTGLAITNSSTLTLTSTNTYSGGTTVAGGSTLAVTQGTLANTNYSSIGSGAATLENGTFQNASGGPLSFSNNFYLGQTATINGNNVSGGTFDTTYGNITISGVVADATTQGSLAVIGGHTLTLINTGPETYTGATTIGVNSTLALSSLASIATSSGVNDNGTFSIASLTNGGTSVQSLSGNGTVTLGSNTLTVTGNGGNFAGAINGGGGLTLNAPNGT